MLNRAALLLCVFLAFGCRTRKPVTPVVVAPPTANKSVINTAEVLSKIANNQVDFNTLTLKAKADLSINNSSNDVSMNIRMQKGKAIWISVTAIAGLEVARAYITPDSIKILNRIESSYTRKPFNYIYQFTSREVTFNTLQNLFIGNAIEGTLSAGSAIEVNGGQTQLRGNLSGLAYLLIFNENEYLIQSNLTDKAASQSLLVNYGEHRSVTSQDLPHSVLIKSEVSNRNITIDLRYSQIALNEPVEFPFSVPRRFSVKD